MCIVLLKEVLNVLFHYISECLEDEVSQPDSGLGNSLLSLHFTALIKPESRSHSRWCFVFQFPPSNTEHSAESAHVGGAQMTCVS